MPRKMEREEVNREAWEGYDRLAPEDARTDWLKLGLMALAYAAWFGLIYLFEPGIR